MNLIVNLKQDARQWDAIMLRDNFAPEVRILASERFNRCWQFREEDPVLAGHNRKQLQEQLVQVELEVMGSGERNLWVIANRSIGTLRERCAARK
jgi:hypothetical protein